MVCISSQKSTVNLSDFWTRKTSAGGSDLHILNIACSPFTSPSVLRYNVSLLKAIPRMLRFLLRRRMYNPEGPGCVSELDVPDPKCLAYSL